MRKINSHTRRVDLSKIKFSPSIDYLTFETESKIDLPRLDGTPCWGRACHFKQLTIHNPSRSDIINLAEIFGPVKILEIEVAVDLRPTHYPDDEDLKKQLAVVMTDVFAKQLHPEGAPLLNTQFRAAYDPKIRRPGPFNKKTPPAEAQLLYGRREHPAQVKCYPKITDQGSSLPSCQWSARIEVRLSGEALTHHGLHTLKDVLGFTFRKRLMPYFHHAASARKGRLNRRKSMSQCFPALKTIQQKLKQFDDEAWEEIGVGAFVSGGERNTPSTRIQSDIELNNRLGQALTRLEREFGNQKFVRKPRSETQKFPLESRT